MKLKRNEKIKFVKEFEGLYGVTTHGRVWSYRRKIWLTPFDVGQGYCTVRLSYQGDDIDKRIHRLVAEAFIPNTDNKPQVNHINGKKWDNRLSNLEWCTARENSQHSSDMGLNSNHKLTYYKKVLICNMFKSFQLSKTEIAAYFGVTVPAICYIIKTYTPILGLS